MPVEWCLGVSPKSLDEFSIETIKQLFLDQTGEVYSNQSVLHLTIP